LLEDTKVELIGISDIPKPNNTLTKLCLEGKIRNLSIQSQNMNLFMKLKSATQSS